MRGFAAVIIGVVLCGFAGSATAQVSQELAEAALGANVQLEMNDGSSVSGYVDRVADGTIIILGRDGRLTEVDRAHVSAVFVDSIEHSTEPGATVGARATSPLQVTVPPPPMVSQADYLFAKQKFGSGTRLRAVGLGGFALAATAIIVGVSIPTEYDVDGCDFDDDACNQRRDRASGAMVGLFIAGLGVGIPTFIIGNRRRAQHRTIIQTYEAQNPDGPRRERVSELEPRESGEVSLNPVLGRHGGGLQLKVTF